MAEARQRSNSKAPKIEPTSYFGKIIDVERRRLQKARAMLECVVIAIEEFPEETDYADIASVARDLINEVITNLDSVSLAKATKRPESS